MASSGANPQPSGSNRSSNFSGPGPAPRNSSSSYSSDAYASPIPGLFTLTLHGNCSRCHHHHSSARFKVNLSRNPNVTTDLRCQCCNEKWLAIGGRNATQLSLPSINSTRPDLVASEVRYSIVNMVRTTIPFATLSPVLAKIAESPSEPSRQQSLRASPVDDAEIDGSPRNQPVDLVRSAQFENITTLPLQGPENFPTALSVQPSISQKYGLHTEKHLAHLKESLGMRFPALHRANLSRRLGIIKQSKISAKRLGKQPVRNHTSSENTMNASQVLNANVPEQPHEGDYLHEPPSQGPGSVDIAATSSDAAAQFLAILANDSTNLSTLTEKEKATWVRAKYTEFKNRHTSSRRVPTTVSVGTSTTPSLATAELQYEEVNSLRGHSLDLFGMGIHYGHLDGYYPGCASLSERISEAETAVDDTITVASGPRYSWIEHLRMERSGSPRPLSLNAYTLQRARRNRNELRRSMESALTEEAVRSTSRPRSSATDRYSHS